MIKFRINGKEVFCTQTSKTSLLHYLRETKHLTATKDGCSGEGICGACTVLIDNRTRLACQTKLGQVQGKDVWSLEGLQEERKTIIAQSLVEKGAVQCGFCTPGIIVKAYSLLENNSNPSYSEIKNSLKNHLCRCTGYVKIIEGIESAALYFQKNKTPKSTDFKQFIGSSLPKYKGIETALGKRKFTNDLNFPNMLHVALVFSAHPRARVLNINILEAAKRKGVERIITAQDIPGNPITGLITQDWPLMISKGETTNYIGDVLAMVVAQTAEEARMAANMVTVDYEIFEPITNMHNAIKPSSEKVHKSKTNTLSKTNINIGNDYDSFSTEDYVSAQGIFNTQRIEHAFLETESAVALPYKNGLHLYTQSQGIYVDRKQLAGLLNLKEDQIRVTQVESGGGFGGKEDMTVQGHVALAAFLCKKPVKLHLSRSQSIRMHPKRHKVYMDMKLLANKQGDLQAIKLYAIGDTGAYASVGDKVMERVAGHATGGYYVPNVDIEAIAAYTNNIPCGAMRGFGANQVAFALESLVDEICEKGGFDKWEFRYKNALREGLSTSTGQILRQGVGIRACLLALKDDYAKNKYTGLACAIKNSGVGNGMIDESKCKIEIQSPHKIIIHHGWTEMGQGVHNMALQTFCQETHLPAEIIEVHTDTNMEIPTGMTTSSRGTALLGQAVINAASKLNKALKTNFLDDLVGEIFFGEFIIDWTTKPGKATSEQITHYSYGYAAQLVVLDDKGKIREVIAAHDAGKIMNPILFEGQIEGAVHMGLGYALRENLPMKDGRLISDKLKDCGVLRVHETPKIKVIGVEVEDKVGPYGAKGVGEIGLVPTAAAVANAFYNYDKKRRYSLPLVWPTKEFPVSK
ncbi:MAG: selenium-dependent xanthine dehydrogenase [Bacteroidetes bacterium 4572_77]|nr:MAG: selenium-dependent xanthine dehydrogenase [Bacteroidetes bacterium 4572_77]